MPENRNFLGSYRSTRQCRLLLHFFFFFFNIYLFIWLHRVSVAVGGLLSCGMWTLSCGMRDLVPWPGIEPGPPALGVWSLIHCATREVPSVAFLRISLVRNDSLKDHPMKNLFDALFSSRSNSSCQHTRWIHVIFRPLEKIGPIYPTSVLLAHQKGPSTRLIDSKPKESALVH